MGKQKTEMRLLISPWSQELFERIKSVKKELIVVSPWVKSTGTQLIIDALADSTNELSIKLITRLSTRDLATGLSDMQAYNNLFEKFKDVQIKCVTNLHAKLYVFDRESMILTSGNLTASGLRYNIEAGIFVYSPNDVKSFIDELLTQVDDAPTFDRQTFGEVCTQIQEQLNSLEERTKDTPVPEFKSIESDSLLVYGKRIRPNDVNIDSYTLKNQPTSRKVRLPAVMKRTSIKAEVKKSSINVAELLKQKAPRITSKLESLFKGEGLDSSEWVEWFAHPSTGSIDSSPYLKSVNRMQKNEWLGVRAWDLAAATWINQTFGDEIYIDHFVDLIKSVFAQPDVILRNAGVDESNLVSVTKDSENAQYFSSLALALLGKHFSINGWAGFYKSLLPGLKKSFSADKLASLEINDAKTRLQDLSQKYLHATPSYKIIDESGPDDNKTFIAVALIKSQEYGKGSGHSKKDAEQASARDTLKSEFFLQQEVVRNDSPSEYKLNKKDEELTENLRKRILPESIQKYLVELYRSSVTKEWCELKHISTQYSTFEFYSQIGFRVWNLVLADRFYREAYFLREDLILVDQYAQKFKGIIFANFALEMYYQFGNERNQITREQRNNAVNALFGFAYVHGGYEACESIFEKNISKTFATLMKRANSISKASLENPISRVQKVAHNLKLPEPSFEIANYKRLPNNRRLFGVNLVIDDIVYGYGESDGNWNSARQDAALMALSKLDIAPVIKSGANNLLSALTQDDTIAP